MSSLVVAACLTGLAFAPPEPDRPATLAPLAPKVEAVEPLGNSVATDAAIVVRFTQPMVREGVWIAVQPQVGGFVTWPDDFTVQFQPIGLAHSTTYQLKVSGHSLSGRPLEGQKEWSFTTSANPAPPVLGPGPKAARIPILTYHYIRNNPDPRDQLGFGLSVTPANFAAQMDWLAQNGYHPVTTADLIAYMNGTRGLPSRPIVITFDDGYADFYSTAIPILRKHDFTAVSYVVSGFIGRPGYMTAAEVVSAQGAGFEIGSHTVDHVNLTKQSNDGLRYQLTASKEALERLLKRPVTSFCYPYGKFGPREAAAVAAAGYQDATTTAGGSYRTMANRFIWTRLYVKGGESLGQFAYTVRADS